MGVQGPNRRGSGRRIGPAAPSNNGPRPPGADLSAERRVFDIPSDFLAGRNVHQQIMDDVARNGYGPDSTFAIRIALEEAIVNAIRHGNRLDPSKNVHVEADVTPVRVEIMIEDEGPGFQRSDVPDCRADENLCRPSGRGILLIESYMNDVKWESGGRRLRMVRENRPGGPPKKAL